MQKRFNLQSLAYIFLIGAFIYAVYTHRNQLVDIGIVLQQGVWYLVLATVIVLGIAIYNQAALYASIYRMLEVPSSRRELVPLYLVRRFVTVAAPSGGFSGWVPFLHFARRRDLSVGAIFIANLVYTILWYSTFSVFLLFGLLFLFLMHDLEWFEISAALVMIAADVIMIGALALAWVAPDNLVKVLLWLTYTMKRFFPVIRRSPPLSEAQMGAFASDLTHAVMRMRQSQKRRLLVPVIHALINEALHLSMFYLTALAFGLPISFGILVAAYSISILFFVVSPTPGGLGFVEGTMILVLTTLGVPAGSATVVTLGYRGISFWLPFVLGFAALRWFRRHPVPDPVGAADALTPPN